MNQCPFCGCDTDECSYWSDAEMGWICETSGELLPDDEPTPLECPHCDGTGWQGVGAIDIECPECGGDGLQ